MDETSRRSTNWENQERIRKIRDANVKLPNASFKLLENLVAWNENKPKSEQPTGTEKRIQTKDLDFIKTEAARRGVDVKAFVEEDEMNGKPILREGNTPLRKVRGLGELQSYKGKEIRIVISGTGHAYSAFLKRCKRFFVL